MKRVILGLFLSCLCVLAACSFEYAEKEMIMEAEAVPENQIGLEQSNTGSTVQEFSNMGSELTIDEPEEVFSAFGVVVSLPENSNWIKNTEYTLLDEKHLEILYYDGIAETNCKMLAVRDGVLDLPEDSYDEALEETWEGTSPAGETVYVKVQHSADGDRILATWEYEEYKFAIQGDVNVEDTNSIPKAALYIISNLADSGTTIY